MTSSPDTWGAASVASRRRAFGADGRLLDRLVASLLVGLGALQCLTPMRGDEFFRGDTIYLEFARALLEQGRYAVGFTDVLYPPGFPAMLALLIPAVGDSHEALLRVMPVFLTLALWAGYALLRRAQGRGCAAVICLVLASSPAVYALATQWVYSDLPYCLASLTALLLVLRLQAGLDRGSTVLVATLCTVMVCASLLIRSIGLALPIGIAAWLIVEISRGDRTLRAQRLKLFVPMLTVVAIVAGAWQHWAAANEVVEWPMLEGHPRNYLSQLVVKSGVQPELGSASVGDFVVRFPINISEHAAGLMELLAHRSWVDRAWYSPLTFMALVLLVTGLARSLRSGGGPVEWYFLAYEAIYLSWPWPFEMRFLLPVAPLAGLYLWRGAVVVADKGIIRSRWFASALALTSSAAVLAAGQALLRQPGRSPLTLAFWVVMLALAAALLGRRLRPMASADATRRGSVAHEAVPQLEPWMRRTLRAGAAAGVGVLVGTGIAAQWRSALENRRFDLAQHPANARLQAADWIWQHTPSAAVVMARQMDVVHHYSRHKVVWLAPLSDAAALMDGVRRLGVDYVVVMRGDSYYIPSEQVCFAGLLAFRPAAFRVAYQQPQFTIYEVIHDQSSAGSGPGRRL